MGAEEPTGASPGEAADAGVLLRVIGEFVAEAVPGAAGARVGLDSRMTTGLGLDSLALVELRARVEEAFGVALPDDVLGAETAGDWLAAVRDARARAGSPAAARRASAAATAPAGGLPAGAETLPGALGWQARASPARVCIRVLEFSGEVPAARELAYAALAGTSAAVAARLRGRGLGPGERVAIMLPTGPEFFTSFMGTLMAGGVAVPVYPPSSRARLEEQLRRQAAIVGNAGAATLITVGEAGLVARLLRSRLPSLRLVASEPELRTGAGGGGGLSAVAAGDLAMLRTPRAALVTPRG